MSPDNAGNWDPLVEVFARHLVNQAEKIGTCAGIVRISDLKSGSNNASGIINRFKMTIPYGGQYIKWEVIFDDAQKGFPPDFIFLSDNGQFFPEISNLTSLVNWKAEDPSSLLMVVKELVSEYKRHNLQKLVDSQLLAQYTSLGVASAAEASSDLEDAEEEEEEEGPVCGVDDVEAYVQSENGHIQFMVKLALDFSNLPTYNTEENCTDDKVLVVITYSNVSNSKGSSKICLSPRLEKAFHLAGGLKTCSFCKDNLLKEYIIELTDLVQKQVDALGQSYESRKTYIASLCDIFKNILEFDNLYFNKISFFVTINDFSFIVHVTLPYTFPMQNATIILISVYQQKQLSRGRNPTTLVSKTFDEYPYSPRWTPKEMADRAKIFIESEALIFQKERNL